MAKCKLPPKTAGHPVRGKPLTTGAISYPPREIHVGRATTAEVDGQVDQQSSGYTEEYSSSLSVAESEAKIPAESRQLFTELLIPKQGDRDQIPKAEVIWGDVVRDIRAGRPVHPMLATYAADCLDGCLRDPSNADAHLGLRKSRGAPSKDKLYFELA